MLKKVFQNKYVSLSIMIVISCLTQILTILKTSVVASSFGVTETMDAYNFANSMVSFIFGFVASGISTIVIPSYVEKKDKRIVNSFITIIYSALLVVVGIVMLFRFKIVGIFSDRSDVYINLVCNVMLVLLLSQYLLAITNITTAFFQCEGKYNIPKIINLGAQLFVIALLVCLKDLTIMQYAFIIASGIAINFVVDLAIAIACGWRFFPAFEIKNDKTKALLKRFAPTVLSTGVYQLSLMIDSLIAERVGEGKITTLSYSSHIVSMINSIIIGNLIIYIYPRIVKNVKNKEKQGVFWNQTQAMHAITCLVIVGVITVGRETVSLLFERGAFEVSATVVVYNGLVVYILGQQFSIIRDLLYRYFYANGDTKGPAINSVWVSVTNIVASIILVSTIGYYGIIIGTVTASMVSLTLILIRFNKKFGFEKKVLSILWAYLKNVIIGAITFGVVFFTKSVVVIESNILAIIIFGVETVVAYCLLQLLFNRKIIGAFKAI